MPVSTRFENLKDGASVEQFLEWFPGEDGSVVEAVFDHDVPALAQDTAERMAPSRKMAYSVKHYHYEPVPMKNITVSVDEELYRLSRVKAAEAGTSVAALVRSYLVELVQSQTTETRFDRLRTLQDETLAAICARGGGLRAADNLPRDELHKRHALR